MRGFGTRIAPKVKQVERREEKTKRRPSDPGLKLQDCKTVDGRLDALMQCCATLIVDFQVPAHTIEQHRMSGDVDL